MNSWAFPRMFSCCWQTRGFQSWGHHKANTCTSSAPVDKLVCRLRRNVPEASNPWRWDGHGDQSGKNGLAAGLQKTVVAKWLGVEGRSLWPADAFSPEEWTDQECFVEIAVAQTTGRVVWSRLSPGGSAPLSSPHSSGLWAISISVRSWTSSTLD